jgi:hypothetical protein
MKRLDEAPESRETEGCAMEQPPPITGGSAANPACATPSTLTIDITICRRRATWTEARSRSWSTKRLILNVKSDMDDELHITLGGPL